MIINVEQKQGKLIVSYVKKDGTIGFSQYTIPPSQQYIYMYSQKSKGIPGLLSWDFKPVRKVATQFINKHRIQEFFMDAGEDNTNHLFENNLPILSVADIEVEVTDEGFAEPEFANNRITSVCFCQYPNVTVFGSKTLTGEECKFIEDNINEHVKKYNRKYSFIYKYHENEADLIYDFLFNYVKNAPLLTGWYFWGYDWRYIINRCKRLNMDISWLSPTHQWYKHRIKDKNRDVDILIPCHKLIVDYMAIYQKWDRSVEIKENSTLDFVAEEVLGIKKVKYAGTLQELYIRDYPQYVFYNAIDSILVELLDSKLKTMSTFLTLGNITRVEAMSAFSPITMLEATLTRYAYSRNQVFPKKDTSKERKEYEGAFVYEPKPNLYEWVASLDFSSLYPTLVRQFKISIENFLFKNKNYNPKTSEIKTCSGAVFDASYEPLIVSILTDYFGQRKQAKRTYLTAEKEADELKKILAKRKSQASEMLNTSV